MAFLSSDTQAGLELVVTLATFVVTTAGWLFDRYVVRRRRLSYRVHWNRPIAVSSRHAKDIGLSIMRDGVPVDQPSLVVLRVENVGSFDIEREHVVQPVEFTFGGRRVVHHEIRETEPKTLKDVIGRCGEVQPLDYRQPGGEPASSGRLRLPVFPIKRRERFKLLVLLSGHDETDAIEGSAELAGGDLVREGRRRVTSRWGLALGTAMLASAGLLVGFLVTGEASPAPAPATPIMCRTGRLAVEGSTALAPAIRELADSYLRQCQASQPATHPQITVTGTGSDTAVDALVQAGRVATSDEVRRTRLAMSDGLPAHASAELVRHPVGIGAFAVVVNKAAGVTNLSTDQVRAIFAGRVTDWTQVGGTTNMKITLVSRAPGSGTRRTFEARVLGRATGTPVSSTDCVNFTSATTTAAVVHCTRENTTELLDTVNAIDGAIGYADAATATPYPNVRAVDLNGRAPEEDPIRSDGYRFWAVENLYTYGQPFGDTVLADFLRYLDSPTARATLDRSGYFPCTHFTNGEAARACATR